tara:strand:- start:8812 stop:9039 length:228 start_codon:yes stop_codon:yes gene_type:complete
MSNKDTKLYIEKNEKTKKYNVLIKVGKFATKEEAAHYGTYVCLTKNIDFDDYDELENFEEALKESFIDYEGRVLH